MVDVNHFCKAHGRRLIVVEDSSHTMQLKKANLPVHHRAAMQITQGIQYCGTLPEIKQNRFSKSKFHAAMTDKFGAQVTRETFMAMKRPPDWLSKPKPLSARFCRRAVRQARKIRAEIISNNQQVLVAFMQSKGQPFARAFNQVHARSGLWMSPQDRTTPQLTRTGFYEHPEFSTIRHTLQTMPRVASEVIEAFNAKKGQLKPALLFWIFPKDLVGLIANCLARLRPKA